MESKTCPKCGAHWLEGQLFWSTGAKASEVDLAGLVCNKLGDEECLNSSKGDETGLTWEKREKEIQRLFDEMDKDKL
jgi:hypothetical protein